MQLHSALLAFERQSLVKLRHCWVVVGLLLCPRVFLLKTWGGGMDLPSAPGPLSLKGPFLTGSNVLATWTQNELAACAGLRVQGVTGTSEGERELL